MKRVHCHQDGPIAVIRLDDGKVNSQQGAFNAELDTALDHAEENSEIRALIVTGREGCFSGGLDLKTLPRLSPEDLRETMVDNGRLMLRLYGFPKPTVALVTGHALAAGCVLMLTCDERIGANGPYRIGLHEVGLGVPLPRFVVELAQANLPAAMWSAATAGAQVYSPQEAMSAGYLHEVASPDALQARGLARARSLGALPRHAFATTKLALRGELIRRSLAMLEPATDAFLRTLSPLLDMVRGQGPVVSR